MMTGDDGWGAFPSPATGAGLWFWLQLSVMDGIVVMVIGIEAG